MQNLFEYLPFRLLETFIDYAPVSAFKHTRKSLKVSYVIFQDLLKVKGEELLRGEGKRDIMSLLGSSYLPMFAVCIDPLPVKANASQNPMKQLSEEEVLAQMQYVFGLRWKSVN